MHRIQEISKIIFITNPDFRISSTLVRRSPCLCTNDPETPAHDGFPPHAAQLRDGFLPPAAQLPTPPSSATRSLPSSTHIGRRTRHRDGFLPPAAQLPTPPSSATRSLPSSIAAPAIAPRAIALSDLGFGVIVRRHRWWLPRDPQRLPAKEVVLLAGEAVVAAAAALVPSEPPPPVEQIDQVVSATTGAAGELGRLVRGVARAGASTTPAPAPALPLARPDLLSFLLSPARTHCQRQGSHPGCLPGPSPQVSVSFSIHSSTVGGLRWLGNLHLVSSSYNQLLFPTADAARPFSMLGLGDIVIPAPRTIQVTTNKLGLYLH